MNFDGWIYTPRGYSIHLIDDEEISHISHAEGRIYKIKKIKEETRKQEEKK